MILLLPCGFKIAQTVRDLNLLTENPAWLNLRAVKEERVYLIDGHHFFNRPGPRLVESAEIVAEILHPDRFSFGHRANGMDPNRCTGRRSKRLADGAGADACARTRGSLD